MVVMGVVMHLQARRKSVPMFSLGPSSVFAMTSELDKLVGNAVQYIKCGHPAGLNFAGKPPDRNICPYVILRIVSIDGLI